MLHVAVRDRRGGYVGGLAQDAFRVSENKQHANDQLFTNQDAPVTVGLLMTAVGACRRTARWSSPRAWRFRKP